MMTHSIRVILAIDHAITREGLVHACGQQSDLELIATAQTGDAARRLIPSLKPDVVVHHALLPYGHDARFLSDLYGTHRPWRCVMLVPLKDADEAVRALAAPADAFLLTNDIPQHIIRTIRAVARGERFTCPLLAASVAYRRDGELPEAVARLGETDRAVFHSISSNMTKAAAARELGITPSDVGSSRIRLCEALHADESRRGGPEMKTLHPDMPFPADERTPYLAE